MALTLTPDDLRIFLGKSDIDNDRAALMLQLAADLAASVVSPLPDTAKGTILAVAARAFTNVSSAAQMGLGSAQIGYSPTAGGAGVGGLYLSRADRLALRRLTSTGGAFSVDVTPADAGTDLPVWDQNVTWLGPMPLIEDQR